MPDAFAATALAVAPDADDEMVLAETQKDPPKQGEGGEDEHLDVAGMLEDTREVHPAAAAVAAQEEEAGSAWTAATEDWATGILGPDVVKRHTSGAASSSEVFAATAVAGVSYAAGPPEVEEEAGATRRSSEIITVRFDFIAPSIPANPAVL